MRPDNVGLIQYLPRTMAIRTATPDDASSIIAIYAPIVENSAISFESTVPGVQEMRERIAKTLDRYPWLVSEDATGCIDGFVYASEHRTRAAYRWAVDATAYVRSEARRVGIGKRLYIALFEELVELGYFQAFAGIALPNPASVALHESVGFECLGIYRNVGYKLGAWHDVGWWQKSLRLLDTPTDPQPFCGRTI